MTNRFCAECKHYLPSDGGRCASDHAEKCRDLVSGRWPLCNDMRGLGVLPAVAGAICGRKGQWFEARRLVDESLPHVRVFEVG